MLPRVANNQFNQDQGQFQDQEQKVMVTLFLVDTRRRSVQMKAATTVMMMMKQMKIETIQRICYFIR